MESLVLNLIVLPALAGLIVLAIGNRLHGLREGLALLAVLANLGIAVVLFGKNTTLALPWAGRFGLEFILRLYHFSGFIVLAMAGFGFVITLYCTVFMLQHRHAGQFYGYLLLSLAFANGAALADNLVLLLFFWEGLLLTLFGMVAIGNPGAWKTAVKALVIVGISDLCMMLGIALTGHAAHTLTISKINLQLTGLNSLAFILMMMGAISKAGAVPFHTWIPDAAVDAPLPFMAFLPAALEKLLGIYLLARITLDMFEFKPGVWLSPLLMIIGAVTILLAVMMALIQTDYKRLLAYHAISQVGYMILGIGTAVPIGIVGGLFHMINHAMYKSCLFLTGGSVERQAGTTDLSKLGGIMSKMPITFGCFVVAAASISGVPPFNGFFSKELIYDGALERGMIFYIAAILGSFLTAASFLKLGHACYLGRPNVERRDVKEAPLAMLIPMITIAGLCVLFGLYNALPLRRLIQPILGARLPAGHDFAGWPHSVVLVLATCVVLVLALLNHMFGVRKSGRGLGAADHIHHAPGLSPVYAMAERRVFDPYEIGLRFSRGIAAVSWTVDRAINRISDVYAVYVAGLATGWIKARHRGNYSVYLLWSVVGAILIMLFVLNSI